MKTQIVIALLLIGFATADQCTGCFPGSSGVCKSSYNVCYIKDVNTGNCPPGSEECQAGSSHYTCANGACSENANGQFATLDDCNSACTVSCQSCDGDSNGQCKNADTKVCYELQHDACPDGSSICNNDVTYYSCDKTECKADTAGKFSSISDCTAACSISCAGCTGGSSGQCKSDKAVCYNYFQNECPSGSTVCDAGVKKYSCVNETCAESATGGFASQSDCSTACSIQCSGCTGASSGQCKSDKDVCYNYFNDLCPSGSTQCTAGTTKYSCVDGTCQSDLSGAFADLASCQAKCSTGGCTGCWPDSGGPCQAANTVCYELDKVTGNCPPGSNACARNDYFLN